MFLYVLLGKKKDKKLHRPCPFCKKDKSKQSLHIRTVYRQDERVRFAMPLPGISRDKIFDAFKKDGILMRNREILVDDSITNKQLNLKKERKHAKSAVAMCSSCKGFYSAMNMFSHKTNCHGVPGSVTTGDYCNILSCKSDNRDISRSSKVQ